METRPNLTRSAIWIFSYCVTPLKVMFADVNRLLTVGKAWRSHWSGQPPTSLQPANQIGDARRDLVSALRDLVSGMVEFALSDMLNLKLHDPMTFKSLHCFEINISDRPL